MVTKAKEELEQEMEEKEEKKSTYLEEASPPLQITGMSLAELQVSICIYYRAAHKTLILILIKITPKV